MRKWSLKKASRLGGSRRPHKTPTAPAISRAVRRRAPIATAKAKQAELTLRGAAAKISKDEADANAKNASAEIDKIRAAIMARHNLAPAAPMPMPGATNVTNGGVIQ